jgi:hypothetical protein
MSDPDRARVQWLDDRTAETARAARRLTAGAAGIAAALLAGLQLADLGALSGNGRIAVVAVAALLAVASVILAVLITLRVMLPRSASIHQLAQRKLEDGTARRRDALIAYIDRNRLSLLRGHDDDLGQLAGDYASTLDERHRAMIAVNVAGDANMLPALERADARAVELNRRIVRLLATARMEDTRRAYDRAARWLALLLTALVLSLIALSWALNAPEHPVADLRGADLTDMGLRGVELRGAILDGMSVERADLRATDLGDASIEDTTWIDTICPDGANSDEAGSTCAGHLEP